jgi:hypothetical protein
MSKFTGRHRNRVIFINDLTDIDYNILTVLSRRQEAIADIIVP